MGCTECCSGGGEGDSTSAAAAPQVDVSDAPRAAAANPLARLLERLRPPSSGDPFYAVVAYREPAGQEA